MTRGFVTVATGKEEYYRQAYQLLRSFRLFHPDTPFAILCDRENEYTRAFTDTVILKNAQRSYLDKFFLLTDCPYDENIFIETDCLIYRSLDSFWELLAKEYDLTAFGYNECPPAFFEDPAYAAEKFLGSPDACAPAFNPGYLFIRRGGKCEAIFRDAMRIVAEIRADPAFDNDAELYCRGKVRDDPVLFLAMKRSGCACAADPFAGKCAFLPSVSKIRSISLSEGKLDLTVWRRPLTDCSLLHFSSRKAAQEGLYAQQTFVLDLICKGRGALTVKAAESRPVYLLFAVWKKISVFCKRKLRRKP
ncbi:MAG: hypothetical protein IJK02_10185 [Clostridia bacterium]|nr:hypothetical protein [Clostridia bacterium]